MMTNAVVQPMSNRAMNLSHLLTQNARRLPDQPALIGGEESWSWQELDAQVSALAAGLKARGVQAGSAILVHSNNSNEMFISMFAMLVYSFFASKDIIVMAPLTLQRTGALVTGAPRASRAAAVSFTTSPVRGWPRSTRRGCRRRSRPR